MKKGKIKVDFQAFYDGFMEAARRKDKKFEPFIELVGELVEDIDYKFSVGDTVFVLPYTETPLNCKRRICGNRWGKIIETNVKSPKQVQEGKMYFVEGSNLIGGWEKEENIELIAH